MLCMSRFNQQRVIIEVPPSPTAKRIVVTIIDASSGHHGDGPKARLGFDAVLIARKCLKERWPVMVVQRTARKPMTDHGTTTGPCACGASLWIARDNNGQVWTFEGEPFWEEDQGGVWLGDHADFLGYPASWRNYLPENGTKARLVPVSVETSPTVESASTSIG